MSMSDTLGICDRIGNGQSAKKTVVEAPASRFRANVLDVLKREDIFVIFQSSKSDLVFMSLNRVKILWRKPVISEIKGYQPRKKGVYSSINDLPRTYNGLGISILYSKRRNGDNEARAAHVGGEILCQVF